MSSTTERRNAKRRGERIDRKMRKAMARSKMPPARYVPSVGKPNRHSAFYFEELDVRKMRQAYREMMAKLSAVKMAAAAGASRAIGAAA